MLLALVLAFAFSGWSAAALCYGLWRGEQGRNADLREIAALRLGAPEPATVTREPDPEERAAEVISQEGRERFIRDLIDEESITPEEARERVDAMLEAHARLGADW